MVNVDLGVEWVMPTLLLLIRYLYTKGRLYAGKGYS